MCLKWVGVPTFFVLDMVEPSGVAKFVLKFSEVNEY